MEYAAVFEGGGVRGIAHVGAVRRLWEAGWRPVCTAGSSAGAIVAALLVAGYSPEELEKLLLETDFAVFAERRGVSRLGLPGRLLSLGSGLGMYDAERFERWLSGLLDQRGVRGFATLARAASSPCPRPLRLTVSDVTDQRLLVLPDDLASLGLDEGSFPVARAVRMSMSIPLFFKPFPLVDGAGRQHLIVDGGLLSGYPLWLFESGQALPLLGFGFICTEGRCGGVQPKRVPRLVRYLSDLASSATDATDRTRTGLPGYPAVETVSISAVVAGDDGPRRVSPVEFALSRADRLLLLQNGRAAAERWLAGRVSR
ncbi:MAG: patatin-like phospholipase family protein [Clostridia bacterium]|nr:patatin-like phospholipase family protein [Clostridia bacterium]